MFLFYFGLVWSFIYDSVSASLRVVIWFQVLYRLLYMDYYTAVQPMRSQQLGSDAEWQLSVTLPLPQKPVRGWAFIRPGVSYGEDDLWPLSLSDACSNRWRQNQVTQCGNSRKDLKENTSSPYINPGKKYLSKDSGIDVGLHSPSKHSSHSLLHAWAQSDTHIPARRGPQQEQA